MGKHSLGALQQQAHIAKGIIHPGQLGLGSLEQGVGRRMVGDDHSAGLPALLPQLSDLQRYGRAVLIHSIPNLLVHGAIRSEVADARLLNVEVSVPAKPVTSNQAVLPLLHGFPSSQTGHFPRIDGE